MYAKRLVVPYTTDGAGNATVFSEGIEGGFIHQLRHVPDATVPPAAGVTFAVTLEQTGEAVWSEASAAAALSRAPRQNVHSTVGAAALYAAGGTNITDLIAIAKDRIKVVVSAGGANKQGTLHFLIV